MGHINKLLMFTKLIGSAILVLSVSANWTNKDDAFI